MGKLRSVHFEMWVLVTPNIVSFFLLSLLKVANIEGTIVIDLLHFVVTCK